MKKSITMGTLTKGSNQGLATTKTKVFNSKALLSMANLRKENWNRHPIPTRVTSKIINLKALVISCIQMEKATQDLLRLASFMAMECMLPKTESMLGISD